MRGCRAVLVVLNVVGLSVAGPARAAETLKVEAAEGGCPRRRDVVAALEARLPGLSRWTISSVTIRRLELSPADTPEAVMLRLWDDRGNLALERRLGLEPLAGRRGRDPRDQRDKESCQALAEAAALVAVRYLREIGYRPPAASVPDPSPPPPAPVVVPPPPPAEPIASPSPPVPPSPAAVAAGAAAPPPPAAGAPAIATVRTGPAAPTASTDGSSGYLGVAGGLRFGPAGAAAEGAAGRGEAVVSLHVQSRWIAASLGAGASSETVVTVTGGAPAELRLRAFPLRLGLALPVPVGGGTLLPTIALSADLLSFRATGLDDARSGLRFDPAGEAGLQYLGEGTRWYLRVSGLGGLTLAPRDFQVGSAIAYRTPAAYFRAQVEVGVRLWKNSPAPRL